MPRKIKAAADVAAAPEPPSSPLSTPPASPPPQKARKTKTKIKSQSQSRQPTITLSQATPTKVTSSAPRPFEDFPFPHSGNTTLVDSPPARKLKVEYNSDDEREVDALEVKEFDWEALLADNGPEKDKTPEIVEKDEDEERAVEVFRPTVLPDGFELDDTALLVKSQTCWYTGVLLEFHPAEDVATRRRYGDQYICSIREEPKPLKRRRKDICFLEDEEIATVILGDHITTRTRITCDADTRAVTPPPHQTAGPSRPPLAPDAFADLSLAEQLRVIRPHLDSVIRDEYAAGRWRADKFFGTPSERASLIRKVQLGDIHPDHSAEIIVPELRRWALRGERRPRTAHPDPPQEPPRPTGSSRYESLGSDARERFIMDVLLPEAVVQLYIRSRGSDVVLAELADPAPEADEDEDETDTVSLNPLHSASVNPPRKKRSRRPHAASNEEFRLYAAARKGLKRLRDDDEENKWAMRDQEVKAKRAAARRRLKLPAEGQSEWEKRQARLGAGEEEGWAGGRPRIKQNYKED